MATITVIKPGHTETAMGAGTACASGGDVVPNDGATILRFTSTHTSDITVTIESHEECSQGESHNVSVTVPADSGDVIVGPFEKTRFDNESEQIECTYSAVTNLKIWALSSGG